MRRITFSRNYTISLSRTCQCYCKYCAFATHQAHVHPPEEVERMLDEAVRRRAKELLFLTGEKPEVNPIVREQLGAWGHEDFTSYVVWACERALERGILPHTNIGVLTGEELGRLREVTASQGLMLESVDASLMETAPIGFQLHAFFAFLLFAMWPFTRLVHVFSAPIGYFVRPYIVYRSRDDRAGAAPGTRAQKRGWERIG